MPYVDKICSVCDHEAGNRYHNVRKCPACGRLALLAKNPYEHQSPRVCYEENTILRDEVNRLRKQLGQRPKYPTYINADAIRSYGEKCQDGQEGESAIQRGFLE